MERIDLNRIITWLKIPGIVVGAIIAVGAILVFFGVEVHGPKDHALETEAKMEEVKQISEETREWAERTYSEHVEAERIYHDTLVYPYIQEMDNEIHSIAGAIDGILRGECLESKFQKLARQGMLDECESLGIERRLGDEIDRELEEGGN